MSVSEVRSGGSPRARRQIWAIGGGKGGIGKSLLAASVGWELARMGRQVVLVDADLGGANLHTRLGLPTPPRTLGDFLQGRCSSIEDVVTATPTLGLRLISGAADLLSAPDIDQAAEDADDEPRSVPSTRTWCSSTSGPAPPATSSTSSCCPTSRS